MQSAVGGEEEAAAALAGGIYYLSLTDVLNFCHFQPGPAQGAADLK